MTDGCCSRARPRPWCGTRPSARSISASISRCSRRRAIALGPKLDLRTSQALVVSPQLQAAIRLLALGNLELANEIAAELERNPLLGLASDTDEDDGAADAAGQDGREAPPDRPDERRQQLHGEAQGELHEELRRGDGALGAEDQDVDYVEERFHHDCAADSGQAGGAADDRGFDHFAAAGPSLPEFLEQQALHLAGADRAIALHIISLLDEAGYLPDSTETIAGRLGVSPADVARVLELVQGFEPTGIGARSLAECIALQAKEADRYDPAMAALIANLDLVARGDVAQLRRICEVDSEDLADMLRELRSYDPKPGLRYGGGRIVPVIPDIFVRRTAAGWTVELNSQTLPRLIIDRRYQAEIAAHAARAPAAGRKEERRFLDSCLSQAQWLMKTLDQRANTMLKVASALVEAQQPFFEHGVLHLRPLTLKQIADRIEMHESTVSRVTSNKYLTCARGLFDLKYFFTTAIQSADGEDVSAEAVRQKLKALIEAEEALRPFSDDKLADLLRQEGHDVARRTVTKYREALGIASSFQRRRRALLHLA